MVEGIATFTNEGNGNTDSTVVTKYVEEKEEGISISPEKEVQEKVVGEEQFTEELNEVARVEFKETEEESWLNVSPGKVGRSTESKPSSETVISPSRFQLLEDVEDEQTSSRNKDIQTYISKDPNHPTEEVEEGEISGNEVGVPRSEDTTTGVAQSTKHARSARKVSRTMQFAMAAKVGKPSGNSKKRISKKN